MLISREERTVFSVLYNESDEFLPRLINNFLSFTNSNSYLVINLPPGRIPCLESVYWAGRVFIFNGAVSRAKVGHSLLLGHIESFDFFIKAVGDFELFCPLASNSLFFRHYDIKAAVARLQASQGKLLVSLDELPSSWWWVNVKKSVRFVAFLRDRWGLVRVSASQIEGLLAARADWETLHSRMNEIAELGATIDRENAFPLEEILPSTFFTNFGSGQFTHICHMFWNRHKTSGGLARIDDFLDTQTKISDHICVMKWFRREAHAIETAAVTQDWSARLLNELQSSLEKGQSRDLLTQRMIIEELAISLRKKEKWGPLAQCLRSDALAEPDSYEFSLQRVHAVRQQISLGTAKKDCAASPAYIYMENTKHEVELEVHITQNAATLIQIDCHTTTGDCNLKDPLLLEGYLYLSRPLGSAKCVFRLQIISPTITEQRLTVAKNIVFARAGRFNRSPVAYSLDNAGFNEYYYFAEEDVKEEEMWFGLPIYWGTELRAVIDVMQFPLLETR
jgi:hypothetical protein